MKESEIEVSIDASIDVNKVFSAEQTVSSVMDDIASVGAGLGSEPFSQFFMRTIHVKLKSALHDIREIVKSDGQPSGE